MKFYFDRVRLGFDFAQSYYTIENVEIFLYNFNFIWFNTFLALIAVFFGWRMLKARSKFAIYVHGFIWFIFLPNTIYILTDIAHLFEDWTKVNDFFRTILVAQYTLFAIVGIISFTVAVNYFRKLLDRNSKKMKISTILTICLLNFIVGFGVVLGGIERTNSWYVITDPSRVLEDALDLIYTEELLMLSIGVGLFNNAVYFIMTETVATWDKKFFKK